MKLGKLARSALIASTVLLSSFPAHALLFRAYVSSQGSDANPCTISSPCRLLPAALAAVSDGGEIWILDSANYNTGTVTIAKSVSILAIPGAVGSVVTTGADAIAISGGTPSVALHNLVIAPLSGAAGAGINVSVAASLAVEDCLFANLGSSGIVVTAPANVRVYRSTFRNVGSGAVLVNESTAASTTQVDIANSTFDRSANAAVALLSGNSTAGLVASVANSVMAQGFLNGISAQSTAGGPVLVSANNNVITNNGGTGISASGAGVKMWASANTVSANVTGFGNSSAIFETPGNNAVRNNTTDTTAGITTVSGT